MKVLFDHQVFSYQQVGGVSRYFSELYRHLPDSGWQVSTGFRRTVNRYLLEQGFQSFLGSRLFKGKTHLLAIWNKIQSIRAIKAGNFDIFHPTYFDPYFLKYIGNKPFVLTIHDMIHELYPESVSDAVKVQKNKKLLAHKAAVVIAVSENTRQDAIRLLGLPPEKVVTIYHGNDLIPRLIQPAALSLPEQFILYVGGRATYKNVDVLWRAFAVVSKSQPGVFLVHAGGGAFGSEELQQLRELGIDHKVKQLLVGDSGLAALYSRAQCLVYPSRYEGFGLPIVEAFAWNCPVIASNTSCFPEIGRTVAVYVDPFDISKWAGAIESMVRSTARESLPEKAARLSRSQEFSWNTAALSTAAVYMEATKVSHNA